DCAAGGLQCPAAQQCTADGHCIGSGSGTDANCPNVHFTAMHTTPSVELLLDRSGSMDMNFGGVSRYSALHSGLTGSMGGVTAEQGSVYFGAALFAGDEVTCPPDTNFDGYAVPRALNNATAIDGL